MPDASILQFFQRAWREAPHDPRAHAWIASQLGGAVFGLGDLFVEAAEHGLEEPQSVGELSRLLKECLRVDGNARGDRVRLDAHSLRVLDDDDDHELFYGFFDATCVARYASELAFALHQQDALPGSYASTSTFAAPQSLRRLAPGGDGDGCTVLLFLSPYDLDWTGTGRGLGPFTAVLPGVRLPRLAAHLCAVVPEPDASGVPWPHPWLLLRACVGASEPLETWLARVAACPEHLFESPPRSFNLRLDAEQASLHHAWCALLRRETPAGPVTRRAATDLGPHHALAVPYGSEGPMLLFDDLWASAHGDLARSMMSWTRHWDPLEAS